MTRVRAESSASRGRPWWRVLDRPLRTRWCTVGWLAASGLFVAVTRLVGGVQSADGWESLVPAAALSHGNVGCMYPPFPGHPSFTAPVTSVVVAVVFALSGVARNAYPQGAALGAHCAHAYLGASHWIMRADVASVAQWTAYLAWAVFVLGVVAFWRTTSRARTRWEPVLAVVLAVTPPIFMTISFAYHPEDLLCLGVLFAGVAALRRDRFVLAGVALAAALLTQQFALLAVIAVVLTLSPRAARPLVPALGATLVVVVGVLAILSHGQVLSSLSTSGDTQYTGATWLRELHVTSVWDLTLLSRLPPVLLTAALSLASRRLMTSENTLVLLIAAAFALRLVFEVNIYGYYFCAVAVSLIVGDALAGRVRPLVVLWLAAEWLFFNPFGWPHRIVEPTVLPLWTNQLAFSLSALALALAPLVRAEWRARAGGDAQGAGAAAVLTSS